MKSIKLSAFAIANIKSMTPAQVRSVNEAISKLQTDGIQTSSLNVTRLPSKQGYVVRANSGTRLTVMHGGGGHLLVDDVFVNTSPAAKKAVGSAITAEKKAPSRSSSVVQNVAEPTVTGSSTRGKRRDTTHVIASAKKPTAKKATAAKKA
ncbi:hypothetical protein ACGLHS_18710 [Variovorax sp. VaC1]|uniref:hypothetical protein n=1 Tax=Variovorax sp. VaC1 TaxID=3373132 RepID=UPI0037492A04